MKNLEYFDYADANTQLLPEIFEIGGFTIRRGIFSLEEIYAFLEPPTIEIGMRHRRFSVGYSRASVHTANAHNCLAGMSFLSDGRVFYFHDAPDTIFRAPIYLPRRVDVIGTLMGGGYDYWNSAKDHYTEGFGGTQPFYIPKPQGYETSPDFSFAFAVNMPRKEGICGYYFNPKGPSGDGWIWD